MSKETARRHHKRPEAPEQTDAAGWSEEKANKEQFEDSSGGSGVKYDAGKPSPARLPSRAVFEVSRVFKHGAEKYDETDKLHDNNWRQGMNWSRLMDAALRHIYAFKQGEDLDRDSGMSHIAHAICSLMMLEEFRHIFPEGDDRDHKWRRGRGYVLDIDGVLANFTKAFQQKAQRMDLVDEVQTPTHWGFPFDDEKVWEAIRDRGLNEFYAEEIEPYFPGSELPVDPVAYVTHRPCDTETTRKWLFENGFPQAPVVTVEEDKVQAANRIADVQDRPLTFVDDRFKNFRELNRAGHHCLLYDRKMNRHHDVGPNYRISDLTELKDDSTYEQT
ncbi:hypothetical protein [Salinibacter phage M31CR41-2]|uniref:dATP/dGTP diphosphohydrolase N-terminal domain-containing protein n=1 Tax=Salinibacter phage M31CR41-2 TaxID=2681614 RepID=A0A2I6UH10_9CAUD|nr:hypothetical protein FGG68_gp49 [Salinibacter phage M31CR41-2]AUO79274.1 hypothetical protein [Salinibacter phage M31CR41-2]